MEAGGEKAGGIDCCSSSKVDLEGGRNGRGPRLVCAGGPVRSGRGAGRVLGRVAAKGTVVFSEEVTLMKRFAVQKTFVLGTGGGRKGGGGGGG
jgi:hypothetical protein